MNDIENEINGLKSLLRDTDYNVNKIIESLVQSLGGVSTVGAVAALLRWAVSTISEYGDILRDRAAWRARINELEEIQQKEDIYDD